MTNDQIYNTLVIGQGNIYWEFSKLETREYIIMAAIAVAIVIGIRILINQRKIKKMLEQLETPKKEQEDKP